MSVVMLDGKKLWVEGNTAYSVEEVTAIHEKAVIREAELKVDLESLGKEIDKLSEDKKSVLNELAANAMTLRTYGDLLDRINGVKGSEPTPDIKEMTPTEEVKEEVSMEEGLADSVVSMITTEETIEPTVLAPSVGVTSSEKAEAPNQPKKIKKVIC